MAAEALSDRYIRPPDFDLATYRTASSRDYERSVYHGEAEVRLSPRGWSLLELLEPHVLVMATRTKQAPDPSGWARCSIPIESIEFGVREVMRLGTEIEVLGPKDLRRALTKTLRTLVQRY